MNTTLKTEARSGRGKNNARALRRAGLLPGVVYGSSSSDSTAHSVAVSVDPADIMHILRSDSGVNTLIELSIDGGEASQVLIKAYQVGPLSRALLHVDFYRVAMDQVITVTVPIVLTGEAAGVKLQGGIIDFVQREVQISCLPSEIPEQITIDVTPLTLGHGVRLGDLLEGALWKPVSDTATMLVHVIASKLDTGTGTDEDEEAKAAADAPAAAKSDKSDD
ncbi:MAG: 50S ribosomal protein L25 [Acidobacteria bacterium]|nr:50S ribosomal protein L25 [Acidobacteriota bacterium]